MAKPLDKEAAKSQADKFKDLAREVGADEDEAAFKRKLARLAKAKQPEKEKAPDD